jgi:hypothetical protein
LITYSYRATNSGGDSNSVFYTYIKDNVFTSATTVPQMPWKTTPTGGYLRGRVTDATTGLPVYNATVTISELGISRKTDGEGKYAFIYIPPGDYSVLTTATGYDPLEYSDIVITAGQVTTRDFALGLLDSDGDGIPDVIESSAPSAAGSSIQPTGDANGDNIPDSQQSHVTSFANAKDGRYITLVAAPGLSFRNVQSIGTLPGTPPANGSFPVGLFDFTLVGLTPGTPTTVDVLLPENVASASRRYWKYGPSADNPTPHWYHFDRRVVDDILTGSTLHAAQNKITLHLADGARGDSDRIANGQIQDPGGPATEDPLLVDLESFTATVQLPAQAVLLEWVTAAEYDNAGFHLYRAGETGPGEYAPGERLTTDLIPAEGSEIEGASYFFADSEPLAAGEKRGYYLEDVDMMGFGTLHGPVFAELGMATPSPTPTITPIPTSAPDTDGDGFADWYEIESGSNPLDAWSVPVLGDYNRDGRTRMDDALLLYRRLLQGESLTPEEITRMDVNLDGAVTVQDALVLYRWAVRMPGYEVLPFFGP